MASVWRRGHGRRRACALALLVVALCCSVRVPAGARVAGEYPRVQPAAIAHLLADYTHRHEGSGAWTIDHETHNFTSWRYTVSYSCGARCAGVAHVESHDEPASPPTHAPAAAHFVRVRDQRCRHPPLLPWPTFCEETEWVARVQGKAGGSQVEEDATAWCSALQVLTGACRREIQEVLERRHQRLRLALRA